jgi:hypothetical protein
MPTRRILGSPDSFCMVINGYNLQGYNLQRIYLRCFSFNGRISFSMLHL